MLVAVPPNKPPEDEAGVPELPNEKAEDAGFEVVLPNALPAAFDVPPNKLPVCDAPDAGVALPNKPPPEALLSLPAVAVLPNRPPPAEVGAELLGVEPKLQLGVVGFMVATECCTAAPCRLRRKRANRSGRWRDACRIIRELEGVCRVDAWKHVGIKLQSRDSKQRKLAGRNNVRRPADLSWSCTEAVQRFCL